MPPVGPEMDFENHYPFWIMVNFWGARPPKLTEVTHTTVERVVVACARCRDCRLRGGRFCGAV
eukprot:1638754-Prymnesium_polylepis.1